MAILNYTTSISTEKTAAEIQKQLAQAKAQAVLCEYDDEGIMSCISFRIMTPHGTCMFKLPANIEGVYLAIKNNRKIPNRLKTREQAARVTWRILKDWVEAQVAIVEAGMASLTEVFLPYAQGKDGKTIYQSIEDQKFKAIAHEPEGGK